MNIFDVKIGQIVRYDDTYAFILGIYEDYIFDTKLMTNNMEQISILVYKICYEKNPLYINAEWFPTMLRNMMSVCLENELDSKNVETCEIKDVCDVNIRAQTEKVNTWILKNKLMYQLSFLDTLMSVEELKKRSKEYLKQKQKYLKKAEDAFYHKKPKAVKGVKSGQVYLYQDYLVIYLNQDKYMVFQRDSFDEDAFLLTKENKFYWNKVKENLRLDALGDLEFNICSISYNRIRIKQIFSYMGFVR